MKRFGMLMALCIVLLAPDLLAQEIKPFVRGSYQKIVAARQGKPFIVNFWSLNCGYCLVEFGMLKKITKKYPRLDVVLVSTDTREEIDQITDALNAFSLNRADTWVFDDSYTERLRFEVDREWQGELPRTYFYNAKNEATAISGKLEYREVERWINEQYPHKSFSSPKPYHSTR